MSFKRPSPLSRVLCSAVLVLGLAHSSAPAFAAAPKPDDRPWAQGVSKQNQDKAFEHFAEGTRLLKDAFFTKAVEQYKVALTFWDHPAIHFNLAKALMNLDQPVDAYNHFKWSMKFGGPPLDTEQVEQVKHYSNLLYDTELAEVVVTCTEPDAVVSLNGNPIFTAPGTWQGVVRPGNVTILATKEGFQTASSKPNLKIGQKNDIALTLVPLDASVQYVRPFSQAIPWTVTGLGLALAGGGALMSMQAGSSYKEYDDAISKCNADGAVQIIGDQGQLVGTVNRCMPTPEITEKKEQGELFDTLALVGYIAGGAAVATGIVLFVVNRERPITTYEERVEGPITRIVPYVGPEGAGVSATIGF